MGSSGALSSGGGQSTTDLLAFLGMSADAVETFPRWAAGSGIVAPADGTLYLTYFTPLVSKTVSTFTISSSISSASSGLTLARIGLYAASANGDATLVARSASNTSLLSVAQTTYAESFSTSGGYPANHALVAGTRYAVGVLQVGTTPGRMMSAGPNANASGLLAPVLVAQKASQSDIDGDISSVAAVNLVNVASSALWCRLS